MKCRKYYQYKPKLNGAYSSKNLRKIRIGYAINLDYYKSKRTHWMALYVNGEKMTYFDSSEVEHISKEIRKFISNKNIKTNIFRIQAKGSIMCG